MAHAESQRRMKLSVLGQTCQKKEDRENQDRTRFQLKQEMTWKALPEITPLSSFAGISPDTTDGLTSEPSMKLGCPCMMLNYLARQPSASAD